MNNNGEQKNISQQIDPLRIREYFSSQIKLYGNHLGNGLYSYNVYSKGRLTVNLLYSETNNVVLVHISKMEKNNNIKLTLQQTIELIDFLNGFLPTLNKLLLAFPVNQNKQTKGEDFLSNL